MVDEPPLRPALSRGSGTAALPEGKAGYASPRLRRYGSVSVLTRGTGGTLADICMFNNTSMFDWSWFMCSDRSMKERIVRVGTHPLGIGLYLFDYKPEFQQACGSGRQFGVMADEVEKVMPRAVCRNAAGNRMVNYAMLGILHRTS